MITSLSRKYARALADVADQEGAAARVQKELSEFASLLRGNSELKGVLCNPSIPFQSKRKIVEAVSGLAGFSTLSLNFFLVILGHNRMEEFETFLSAFLEVMDQRAGIVRVDVYSSGKLGEQVQEELQREIAKLVRAQVKLKYHVDDTVIGGVRIQVGSTVYDGTVRTQLEQLKRRLTA